MRKLARWPLAVATVLSAIFGVAAVARADDVVVDGDGLTPVGASSLNFGTVCTTATTSKEVIIGIIRTSNGNVFKDDTAQTISASQTSAQLAVLMNEGQTFVPGGWESKRSGTIAEDTAAATVTLAPGGTGSFSGSAKFTATGVRDIGQGKTTSRWRRR